MKSCTFEPPADNVVSGTPAIGESMDTVNGTAVTLLEEEIPYVGRRLTVKQTREILAKPLHSNLEELLIEVDGNPVEDAMSDVAYACARAHLRFLLGWTALRNKDTDSAGKGSPVA